MTALPAATWLPPVGLWLITVLIGAVALGWVVTVPTARPAPVICDCAVACVCATTFGTLTVCGPEETTRLTALPAATWVPPVGLWLITVLIGAVALGWVVTVPTARPAPVICDCAVACVCATTFGTLTVCGPGGDDEIDRASGRDLAAARRALADHGVDRRGRARLGRHRTEGEASAGNQGLCGRLSLSDDVGNATSRGRCEDLHRGKVPAVGGRSGVVQLHDGPGCGDRSGSLLHPEGVAHAGVQPLVHDLLRGPDGSCHGAVPVVTDAVHERPCPRRGQRHGGYADAARCERGSRAAGAGKCEDGE